MPTPHVHAEFIKAWADGQPVQFRYQSKSGEEWLDLDPPARVSCAPRFDPENEYRIKPQDPVVKWLWAVEFADGRTHLSDRFATDSSEFSGCYGLVKRFIRLDWTRTEFPQE